MARRYYNGTVRDYNTAIQSFPDVLIAKITGFREEQFFQTEAESAVLPAVNFARPRL
jgi:LemA protein